MESFLTIMRMNFAPVDGPDMMAMFYYIGWVGVYRSYFMVSMHDA
jgi:cytochrome c